MLLKKFIVREHLVLSVSTNILMGNSRVFLSEFQDALNSGEFKMISLNLEKVNYFDSSGAGAIIKSANLIRSSGIILNAFNLNKTLYSVFQLCGFHAIMNLISLEDFLEKFPDFQSQFEKKQSRAPET